MTLTQLNSLLSSLPPPRPPGPLSDPVPISLAPLAAHCSHSPLQRTRANLNTSQSRVSGVSSWNIEPEKGILGYIRSQREKLKDFSTVQNLGITSLAFRFLFLLDGQTYRQTRLLYLSKTNFKASARLWLQIVKISPRNNCYGLTLLLRRQHDLYSC